MRSYLTLVVVIASLSGCVNTREDFSAGHGYHSRVCWLAKVSRFARGPPGDDENDPPQTKDWQVWGDRQLGRTCRPVSKAMGNVKNDGPKLLA